MYMKQTLLKSLASRLLGLLVVFLFAVSIDGMAQVNSSATSSSGGSSGSSSSVSIQPKVKNLTEKMVNNPVMRTQTRSGNILKITHEGSEQEYADWQTAMSALQDGDEITLLDDVTLYESSGDLMPDKACTINGGSHSLTNNYNGLTGSLNLRANVTFKSIELSVEAVLGNGFSLVFDAGVTVKADCEVYGGGELGTDVVSTSITIRNGATLDNVYGGGYSGKVTGNTLITVEGGTTGILYGGGYNEEAVVEGSANITINNATAIKTVYGGGYSAPVVGAANFTINGGTVGGGFSLFGGGCQSTATCGSTNVTLVNGTVNGWLFGGGYLGSVTGSTNVSLQGGTVAKNVYGGGSSSDVLETANVTLAGTTITYNLFGGGEGSSTNCKNTHVTVSSGSVNWLFGGGQSGQVTEVAKLILTGGTVRGTACGAGASNTSLCRSTDVSIESGNWGYIYAGGESGSVTGECHLKVSGTPTITGSVFGGSMNADATVGSTRLEITGGTFKDGSFQTLNGPIFAGGFACTVEGNTSLIATGGTMGVLYGGCLQGSVVGATYVEVNGATLDGGIQEDGKTPNSATINGGGFGDDDSSNGYSPEIGIVGSTKVVVKNVTPGTAGIILYGGGLYSGVTGNTDVTIEGGTFKQVWGSSYTQSTADTQYQGVVGGNVNVLVKGGTIATLGAARDQIPGKAVPVVGTMNLTIEGGTITEQIGSGNHPDGNGYKPCTLTVRNLGSESSPYALPRIYAMTSLVLDKSVVTTLAPIQSGNSAINLNSIVVDEDYPMTITGDGKLVGNRIILQNFQTGSLPVDVPLVIGIKQLVNASFVAYEGLGNGTVAGLSTLPIYKVGNTYRKTEEKDPGVTEEVIARTVTITASAHGKPSVVWKESGRTSILDSGDKVPVDTELTLSLAPDAGYQGGVLYVDGAAYTGATYKVTDDVEISAGEFTKIPDPTPDPDPVYYSVTLPVVEGVIFDPTAGVYSVENWDSFVFYLTLDKDYNKSMPVVKTSRNETIEPRKSDGAYIIKYVRSDINVLIEGVVKNPDPVANTEIQSGIKVWTNNHQLFIRTDKPEEVSVYTFGGQLQKKFRSEAGDRFISLSSGTYIVLIGDERFKVIL